MGNKDSEAVSAHIEKAINSTDDAAERGRLIQEQERQLSLWETAKLHPRAVLACSIAFTAGAMFGYDQICNGSTIAMPSFMMYFGNVNEEGLYLPSIWTSLWTSMTSLLQAIGAICIGMISDRVGRKWPGVIAGILSLAGTAVIYYAKSRGALLAGKMVCGLALGAGMAIGTTYASEVAPLKLRNPIQTALVLFIVFMQGLALGIVRIFVPYTDEQAFRNVFAIQWAVGGIFAIACFLAPESPIYLINRNRTEEARKVMNKLYNRTNIDDRLAYLVKTISEEQEQQRISAGSYLNCFQGTNLKRTLTVMFLYSTANLGGAAFLSQSIYFLLTLGLPSVHVFDISIGGFALAVIIIVATGAVGKLISRRNMLLTGCAINLAFMTTIGSLYYAPGMGPAWAIAVLMNILISVQNSLLQAIGWPIAAEISSYRLRVKTLSIGVFAQTLSTWVMTFTVPYMYNVDSGDLGARTAFPFAGISVLLLGGVWVLVPETTGLSTEEIDRLYEEGVSVRRFRAYGPSVEGAAEGR
ncbi:MFS-type transporter fmqE [Aspergillus stella-maris]|uniref:MFS-type transporter fmqE n=1 Tax=Aspergillus stella-maris TaxID=1810926 RepID=UPI003CCCF729